MPRIFKGKKIIKWEKEKKNSFIKGEVGVGAYAFHLVEDAMRVYDLDLFRCLADRADKADYHLE